MADGSAEAEGDAGGKETRRMNIVKSLRIDRRIFIGACRRVVPEGTGRRLIEGNTIQQRRAASPAWGVKTTQSGSAAPEEGRAGAVGPAGRERFTALNW
jgi:hypothetical protein